MRQRDERRAVGIDGKPERCERPRGCRHGIGSCASYSTVPKGHDIDCSRKRIGFQRHEQALLVEHTHLCRATHGRRSASRQLQRCGAFVLTTANVARPGSACTVAILAARISRAAVFLRITDLNMVLSFREVYRLEWK